MVAVSLNVPANNLLYWPCSLFMNAGLVLLSHSPLRPGDGLVCSHLTKCIVCPKPLAIFHFGHFGSSFCASTCNVIQGYFSA